MRYTHLSAAERDTIGLMRAQGVSKRAIARALERSHSTVIREVNRFSMFNVYQPVLAQDLTTRRRKQLGQNATKAKNSKEFLELVQAVCELMEKKRRSIQQALRELKRERPGFKFVTHETIYNWVYHSGTQLAKRRSEAMIRRRRKRRSRRTSKDKRGGIANARNISESPEEAYKRDTLGFIEGDLVVGKDHKSVVATLVDMASRQTWILPLGDAKAVTLTNAIKLWAPSVGYEIKSITWDNGKEMADHAKVTKATGIDVYFADPHSPWQRPLNEQTNGVIRRWWPKGTDLPQDQETCDIVAHYLNTRVMPVLSGLTPLEARAQLSGAVSS